MAAPCVGVVGTFQYTAPRCSKQQQADTTTSDAVIKDLAEEDPQARCEEKGGKPDELKDICPKCNDEVVWVRRRIDVSHPPAETRSVYFLANVNSRSRSLYAIARPSVVCRL